MRITGRVPLCAVSVSPAAAHTARDWGGLGGPDTRHQAPDTGVGWEEEDAGLTGDCDWPSARQLLPSPTAAVDCAASCACQQWRPESVLGSGGGGSQQPALSFAAAGQQPPASYLYSCAIRRLAGPKG